MAEHSFPRALASTLIGPVAHSIRQLLRKRNLDVHAAEADGGGDLTDILGKVSVYPTEPLKVVSIDSPERINDGRSERVLRRTNKVGLQNNQSNQ